MRWSKRTAVSRLQEPVLEAKGMKFTLAAVVLVASIGAAHTYAGEPSTPLPSASSVLLAQSRQPYDWNSPATQAPRQNAPQQQGSGFTCGLKRYCGEMTSCAEAYFYLNQCGLRRLDGDGDGVPCERICGRR
jgi:hypothetical protein